MRQLSWFAAAAVVTAACSARPARQAQIARAQEVVRLWPGQAPGTESWTGPEQIADADIPNVGKVHVVTNVTVPTLTVFRAAAPSGAAMIVIPGGAFRALAWDLDGIETAHWLVRHGITAFVLKYRVRPPASEPADKTFEDFVVRTRAAQAIALADAEQALHYIRAHAARYGVAPGKVGMIGFSAGAMTVMNAAVSKDPAARPDLAVSGSGALLTGDSPAAGAPAVFIVQAQDDPQVEPAKALEIFRRWTAAGLPAELHLYEKGGHGFGFRQHHLPIDHWPDALEAWLSAKGFIGTARPR